MTNQAVQNILVNQPTTFAEILQRFGPDPMSDDPGCAGVWYSACRGMLQEEEDWRRRGRVFSWIDEEPTWVSAAEWYNILPDPEKPCRRFRLSLLGGGQIEVTEKFVCSSVEPDFLALHESRLKVYAYTVMGLRVCHGVLAHGVTFDMAAKAVVFPRGTPQEIVDRTAQTLRLIDNNSESFCALLLRERRCACCNRPLKDEISKLLGIDAGCTEALGLPHTVAFADRMLERRRELLGEAS